MGVCFVLCVAADSWLEWTSGAREFRVEKLFVYAVYVFSCVLRISSIVFSCVLVISSVLFTNLELAVFLIFPAEFSPSNGFLTLGFSIGDVDYSPKCPFLHCPQLRI